MEKKEFNGSVFRYRLKPNKTQTDTMNQWMETTKYLQNKTLNYYIKDYHIAHLTYLGYLSSEYPKWYSKWEVWNKETLYNEAINFIKNIEKQKNVVLSDDEKQGIINKIRSKWRIKKIPPEQYYYGTPVRHQGYGEASTYQYYSWLKENELDTDIRLGLNDIPAVVAQEALSRVDKAYASFYRGGGFPKFKKDIDSLSWSQSKPFKSIKIKDNKIYLPKLGEIAFVNHRALPEKGIIKRVNVIKTSTDKYFINILCEYKVEPRAHPENIIAYDRNIRLDVSGETECRKYATGYDGKEYTDIDMPTFYREDKHDLKRAQRKVSRCKTGSDEWVRAKRVVNKIYERINNRTNNWRHNETRKIADNYKRVILEDLSITDMTNKDKGKRKAAKKSTKKEENRELTNEKNKRRGFNETAHYAFETALAYKLRWNGGEIIKVNPAYTSQTCSKCGYINKTLSLSDTTWTCPKCDTYHHRDRNASANIYAGGLKVINDNSQQTVCETV